MGLTSGSGGGGGSVAGADAIAVDILPPQLAQLLVSSSPFPSKTSHRNCRRQRQAMDVSSNDSRLATTTATATMTAAATAAASDSDNENDNDGDGDNDNDNDSNEDSFSYTSKHNLEMKKRAAGLFGGSSGIRVAVSFGVLFQGWVSAVTYTRYV